MRVICIVCGRRDFAALPNPRPNRSIASDLRVVAEPLDKHQCRSCGAIRRGTFGPDTIFDQHYELYAHDPGRDEETRRQRGYADWLARALDVPSSCYEAGSGNGSLLLALRERWADTAMAGIEPAAGAAAAARRAGLDVEAGFLHTADSARARAELAFAVNVIEHTPDPRTFLRDLASHGERIAVICPDATVPNNELLFCDHLQSLRPDHLTALFGSAGLSVDIVQRAPEELGSFQLVSGRAPGRPAGSEHAPPDELHRRYLETWGGLDDALLARSNGSPLIAFGAGEAAGLLRAYAPRTWSAVSACAIDAPAFERFGELPVIDARTLEASVILLAVRPAVQAALDRRLRERGHRVIRWDDLICR